MWKFIKQEYQSTLSRYTSQLIAKMCIHIWDGSIAPTEWWCIHEITFI